MSIERLTPSSFNDNYGTVEHLHRYALAIELCKNKKVLDVASGEGYGSNLLASVASGVIGIDISKDAVAKAAVNYKKENLQFKVGSALELPLEDNVIDVVVSFETIEHLTDHERLLSEFKRVLKNDGVLIISSPAKEFYSLKDPNNPYHLKELTIDELISLCRRNFTYCDFLYQRIVAGTVISKDRQTGFQGRFEETQYYDGTKDGLLSGEIINSTANFNIPFFVVAICANSKMDMNIPGLSFFDASSVVKAELDYLRANLDSFRNSRILKLSTKIRNIFRFS